MKKLIAFCDLEPEDHKPVLAEHEIEFSFNGGDYLVDACSKHASEIVGLLEHLAEKGHELNGTGRRKPAKPKPDKKLVCPECGETRAMNGQPFVSERGLSQHRNKMHGVKASGD